MLFCLCIDSAVTDALLSATRKIVVSRLVVTGWKVIFKGQDVRALEINFTPIQNVQISRSIRGNWYLWVICHHFFHQVLNYYYLTVYIMFKPKMSLEGSVH